MPGSFGKGLIGAIAVLTLTPALASAATITVNTTTDEFNSPVANGTCSLREAIRSIEGGPGNVPPPGDMGGCVATGSPYGTAPADTIMLPAGTYQLTLPGVDDNDASGDLDTGKNMSIVGTGNPTIQQTVPGERVIDETASPYDLSLSGLTITGGKASGGAKGGGIHFAGGGGTASLSVNDVTVTGNDAAYNGNTAEGGGIWTDSTTTITNSTISGNKSGATNASDDGNGGGIFMTGSKPLTVQGSTISNNEAGGTSNVASGGLGGGIYRTMATGNTPSDLVEDTSLSGNRAANFGGGIYVDTDGTMRVRRSTLTGNSTTNVTAEGGGAIQADSLTASLGMLELTNSTVTGNSSGRGGGIRAGAAGPAIDTTLLFTTVADNTSNDGSQLQVNGDTGTPPSFTIGGSIIADTVSLSANTCKMDLTGNAVTVVDKGYNITTAPSAGGPTGNCGVGSLASDRTGQTPPLVGALANNGGPTQTMIPLSTSFAIDGIPLVDNVGLPPRDCSTLKSSVTPAITTDQRGLSRPNTGGQCDSGALEYVPQACQPVSVSTAFQTAAPVQLSCGGGDGAFTYSLVTNPTHGTISGLNTATGALTYTPDAGYSGGDSFTYRATGPSGDSSAAGVGINVAALPANGGGGGGSAATGLQGAALKKCKKKKGAKRKKCLKKARKLPF